MSAKKETAVDFYALAVSRLQIAIEGKKISLGEYAVGLHDAFKQAKQLEKEQIEDAWTSGIDNCGEFDTPSISTGKHYYSQTFGTQSDGTL